MSVNYHNGAPPHYEVWEKLALYCPNCGQKEVWHDTDSGDIEVGEEHLCAACFHGFYLPNGTCDMSDKKQSKQRLEAIKAANSK